MTALQDPASTVRRPRLARWHPAPRGSYPWVVSTALFWLAAVTVAFGLDVVAVGAFQYSSAQSDNYAALRTSLADGTAPVSQTDSDGVLVPIGTPVALLSIPRIGISNMVVVEGTSSSALQAGPGHERDTRFPGQAGVAILQGRAAAYGGPFGDLGKLQPGDRITVVTGQDASTFRVIDQRREGDPTPPLTPGSGRLTLVTAAGLAFVPTGVLRVDAALTSPVKENSIVVARDLPAAEQPMGTMPDTLPVTILALQSVIVLVLGAVFCWLRWSHLRTWIVFGPAVGLAIVLVGSRITMLLPNLM